MIMDTEIDPAAEMARGPVQQTFSALWRRLQAGMIGQERTVQNLLVALLADGPCALDRLAALAGLAPARLAGVMVMAPMPSSERARSRQSVKFGKET